MAYRQSLVRADVVVLVNGQKYKDGLEWQKSS